MVSITLEVSERLAKFLTHPGIHDLYGAPVGELIEDAFTDALYAWAGQGWTIEKEIEIMEGRTK